MSILTNSVGLFLCIVFLWACPYNALAKTHKVNLTTTPKRLKKFAAWVVYSYKLNNKKICYAVSAPISITPHKGNIAHSYFLISRRPNLLSKDVNLLEPQFLSAYRLSSKSVVKLSVIGKTIKKADFQLYVRDKFAWLHSTSQERSLIGAMQKGSSLELHTITSNNNKINYSFSLVGLTNALREVTLCR